MLDNDNLIAYLSKVTIFLEENAGWHDDDLEAEYAEEGNLLLAKLIEERDNA